MCSTPTNGAGWGGGPTFGEEAGLGPRRGRSNVEEGTVLGNTPDDVLRLLDDGAVGIVAVVPDAGASFLAPIQEDLAALVCLTGNTESHLAIVSRDFGTPALMAFAFDGAEPEEGREVEVDTDAGTLSLA